MLYKPRWNKRLMTFSNAYRLSGIFFRMYMLDYVYYPHAIYGAEYYQLRISFMMTVRMMYFILSSSSNRKYESLTIVGD